MYVRTHSPKSAPSWCWRKCFPAARVAFPSLQVAPAAAAFAVPQPRAPVRTPIHFSHSCVLVCVGVMLHQSVKLPSARACFHTPAKHAKKTRADAYCQQTLTWSAFVVTCLFSIHLISSSFCRRRVTRLSQSCSATFTQTRLISLYHVAKTRKRPHISTVSQILQGSQTHNYPQLLLQHFVCALR